MKCPNCGSQELTEEMSSGFNGYRCRTCGDWSYAEDVDKTLSKLQTLQLQVEDLQSKSELLEKRLHNTEIAMQGAFSLIYRNSQYSEAETLAKFMNDYYKSSVSLGAFKSVLLEKAEEDSAQPN